MPLPGRWFGPALGRSALALICACRRAPVGGAAGAREVVVTGSKMDRFGRILLQFDRPTKVSARVANAVLVITFAEPAKIKSRGLRPSSGPYVTAVRRDPDDTGLRLALAGPVRLSVLEAAERVFIDLLPPNWTGMPPSLPSEVVAELAARIQEAEAKLRAAMPRPVEPPKSVRLRIGETAALTRFVFETAPDLPVRTQNKGDELELVFEGQVSFDNGGAKPKLAAGIAGFDAVADGRGLAVRIKSAPGYAAQTFREPDGLVVDLARPQPVQTLPDPAPSEPRLPAPRTPDAARRAQSEPAAAPPAIEAPPGPPARAETAAPVPKQAVSAPQKMATPGQGRPKSETASGPSTVVARVEAGPDSTSLHFPFRTRTPAAAFVRSGVLTLVFETPDRLDVGALASSADPSLRPLDVRTENGLTILRLPEPPGGAARFVADGDGWRVSTGNGNGTGLPGDSLGISRGLDEHGRPLVRVGLADASRAHWMTYPDGARLAVVTAAGRVQAIPLPRNFVEFGLAPTLHGVVVEARADDVTVGLGQGGVAIAREVGLSLSPAGRNAGEERQGPRLALPRDGWTSDVGPAAFDRYMALLWETAHANKAGRAEARARLARFLIASGMNHEAGGVLALPGTRTRSSPAGGRP
jgi:hypothetical protein